MAVSVGWVLAQPDLGLRLAGGAAGLSREIALALTTELVSPFRWLSGGELVLTTGIRLPQTAAERLAYLRGLDECHVAALGFATGLTHTEIPADLAVAADEIGIPLVEVPLRTPFAAIVKQVMARLAEQQYEAVLRASRAQPRMTRAGVSGGTHAIVAELAKALSSTVLVLDPAGAVVECLPRELDSEQMDVIRSASAAASGVSVHIPGISMTHQRISVGRRSYGVLVVVGRAPLSHVDQILLGHANSLLALDFEKPARLEAAQQQLNSGALGMVLGADADLGPARAQLAYIADARGRIRVLVIDCETARAVELVRSVVPDALRRAGYPVFMYAESRQLTVLLPGAEDTAFAGRLTADLSGAQRKWIRIGLSSAHSLDEVAAAAGTARLAAAAAERGAVALEFAALTGRALLSSQASRDILTAVADTTLTPLIEYDSANGTHLMESLHAFLEANGHWESAAAATGVHRHTLRKRIANAQTLLGCDLDNARVRAELLLAILVGRSGRIGSPGSSPER